MKEFIDATVFLGMHSTEEKIRVACKNFFIKRLHETLFMSLENVGKCDDVIWQFDRETQDAYYPFMDRLHTIMDFQRIAYDQKCLDERVRTEPLSLFQQLTLAQALNDKLYTFDKMILELKLEFTTTPPSREERFFPEELESFYNTSLKLRIQGIENLHQGF